MGDWQPIETAPIEPFRANDWFMPHSRQLLLWRGGFPCIGAYSYTEKGKGRWRANGFTVNPTHWMPIPEPPK